MSIIGPRGPPVRHPLQIVKGVGQIASKERTMKSEDASRVSSEWPVTCYYVGFFFTNGQICLYPEIAEYVDEKEHQSQHKIK